MDFLSALTGVPVRLRLNPNRVQLGLTPEEHVENCHRLRIVFINHFLDPNDNQSRFRVEVRDADGNGATCIPDGPWTRREW